MAYSKMVRSWQARNNFVFILSFLFVNVCMGHPMIWNNDQNSGNEVPLVHQQNGHEPSKFLSYNHEHEYPHQPVDFGHFNLNQKYGYHPDTSLQLSNVGLHQQHDQHGLSDGFQYLHELHLPRYLRKDQQPIYRGNEAPVVQQQNEPEPSKFLTHNQQLEYPHQPANLGNPNLNQKYDYPDNLMQLSNVGLHQEFDKRSVSEEYHPLNEPLLSRYPREYGQPMSRQYGQPMSRQYGQPMSRQYGQPMKQGSRFLSARPFRCRYKSYWDIPRCGLQGFPEGRWWDD